MVTKAVNDIKPPNRKTIKDRITGREQFAIDSFRFPDKSPASSIKLILCLVKLGSSFTKG